MAALIIDPAQGMLEGPGPFIHIIVNREKKNYKYTNVTKIPPSLLKSYQDSTASIEFLFLFKIQTETQLVSL